MADTDTKIKTLNQIIRDVQLAYPDNGDKSFHAKHVIERISPEDYGYYLMEILPEKIGQSWGINRNASSLALKSTFSEYTGGTAEAPAQAFLSIDPEPVAPKFNNTKMLGIHAKFMAERVPVATGYKLVRDLTAEDCRYVAQVRYDKAKANKRVADQYSAFAERLESDSVASLGNLDSKIVSSILNS